MPKYRNNLMRDVNNLMKKTSEGLRIAMQDTLLDVQTTAKSPGYVPYKTGNLKRSMTTRLDETKNQIAGYIGSNVVYAAIQEFGGRAGRKGSVIIRPKYYMTRAIKDNLSKLKQRLEQLKLKIK